MGDAQVVGAGGADRRGVAAHLGQRLDGALGQTVGLVVQAGKDAVHPRAGDPVQRLAVVQQMVDIIAVALGAWHTPRRGVGLLQQAQPGQGGHLVAQRRAGDGHIKIVGKDAAAYRLALDAVEGNDRPQHTLLALIHCHAVLPPCLDGFLSTLYL